MFSIAVSVVINLEQIKKYLQGITKIKLFIEKFNWERINYPSEKGDQKKLEKNNLRIALNVLYANKENMYSAYVSKHNSNCEKTVMILMIPNREG